MPRRAKRSEGSKYRPKVTRAWGLMSRVVREIRRFLGLSRFRRTWEAVARRMPPVKMLKSWSRTLVMARNLKVFWFSYGPEGS